MLANEIHELRDKCEDLLVKEYLRLAAQRELKVAMSGSPIDAHDLTGLEIRLGEDRGKIAAIKEYRNRTGSSLLDSKNAVEAYFSRHFLNFRSYV